MEKNIPENRIKYKSAKATYNVVLDEAKCSHYNSKIKDAGQDSREVNRVMKKTLLYEDKASPLPDHESPQDLADKFALFFIGKIEKIRRELPQVESVEVPL